eukprot:6212775-Pleurochrysis_carterae.AAC.1
MEMRGMPIRWDELWSKLAGRLPRPHHQSTAPCIAQGTQVGGTGADSLTRTERATTAAAPSATTQHEQPLALINNVTGINYPTNVRQAARTQQQMSTAVREMPMSAPGVEMGRLYFISIPDFEGELRVGVGRREQESGVEMDRGMVAWLQRYGWSNNPAKRGFSWAAAPQFVVARSGLRQRGAPMRNTEPLSSFLPVPVTLTSTSTYNPSLPLTDPQQKIRVCKQSVDSLKEFCRQKCPELIRTAAQAQSTAHAPVPSTSTAADAALGSVQGDGDEEEADGEENGAAEDSSTTSESEASASDSSVVGAPATGVTRGRDDECAVDAREQCGKYPKRRRVGVSRFV